MLLTKSLKYSLYILVPIILSGCGDQPEPNKRAMAPTHVDTLTLSPTSIRLSKELPGRITAFKEAEVRPQVSGILKSRLYKEGSQVNAGDVLYQIDPLIYQLSVNSAKAGLVKSLANEESTKKSFDRNAELLKKNLVSQEVFDDAESAYLQAKAEVSISQADLNNANLLLSYTKITAPISGRIGISLVSEGSLLTAEQSSYLTTIIQTDNVYIDMQHSSVSLYKIKQDFSGFKNKKAAIPVTITLEDGSAYAQTGYLEFADTQVADSTGTVTLRAIIPNPDNTLLAGMYVRSHISMPEARDYLVVPQSSVVRSQSGAPSVFTVTQENKTLKKSVVLGNEVDNGWVVKEGLATGEQVVISNIINMKNNLDVIIDSTSNATSSIKPTSVGKE